MQWDDSVNSLLTTTVKISFYKSFKKILLKSLSRSHTFWSEMLSEWISTNVNFYLGGGGERLSNFFGPFFLNFLDPPLMRMYTFCKALLFTCGNSTIRINVLLLLLLLLLLL